MNGCHSYKPPELKAVEDIRVRSIGGDKFELNAKLVFHNPNEVKFKFRSYHIEIFIDENKITELNDDVKRTIYPNTDFDMNAVAEFSLKEIDGNLLSSALGLLSNRSKVRFMGNIKLSRNGFGFTIPVDQEEKIKF